jgi:hypothetical protein
LRINTRADGRDADTVDTVIACGSVTPLSTACSSHALNNSTGSSGARAGSNSGAHPTKTGSPRSKARRLPVGGALTLVAAATYLMAVGKDTGSWVCYGLAGAITLAMPVIPWLYLRRLGEVLELPSRFG